MKVSYDTYLSWGGLFLLKNNEFIKTQVDEILVEIIDVIKTLSVENYSQGPELDDKKAVFWSYHIPEYPMVYPFKV